MKIPFPAKWVKVGEHGLLVWAGAFFATYTPVILGADRLHDLVDLSVADKASTAGIAAVFAVVLASLGLRVGDPESTSFVAHLAETDDSTQ